MFRNFTTCLVVSALSSALFAQDDYQPKVAGASAEAAQAMSTFVLPEGMKVSLLAAEPNVANPVAFHITGDGRVFMCETFRQEVGVEDNRSHMNWLDNDLQLQTVEERLAMFRRYLGHDVHNYAKEHDRIRVLRDSNGDGTLDEAPSLQPDSTTFLMAPERVCSNIVEKSTTRASQNSGACRTLMATGRRISLMTSTMDMEFGLPSVVMTSTD